MRWFLQEPTARGQLSSLSNDGTVCVCVCLQGSMRVYHEAHPDTNSDDHVRSVLTKAERQLKDKFDGRPTKPPP